MGLSILLAFLAKSPKCPVSAMCQAGCPFFHDVSSGRTILISRFVSSFYCLAVSTQAKKEKKKKNTCCYFFPPLLLFNNPCLPVILGSIVMEATFKVVVVGDVATGKTSFIKRSALNYFNPLYRATIGTDYSVKSVFSFLAILFRCCMFCCTHISHCAIYSG